MKILAKIWANVNPAGIPIEIKLEKIKNGYLMSDRLGEHLYFKEKKDALDKMVEIISWDDE